MKTPVEIGRAIEGARYNAALPGLQEEFRQMEEAIKTRVFTEIEKNKLTPEQALWAWMELYATRRLERRLRTRAALSAAELEDIEKESANA